MNTKQLHERTIQEIAEDYRARGYEVLIEPKRSELPKFLSAFRPDIIARGPNESVVIEVKVGASRTSVAQPLKDLADHVHREPGWRLAVYFVDPEQPDRIAEVQLRDADELYDQLNRSQQLADSGYLDAAFLLLWSTMEATLRQIATNARLPISALPPTSLLRELYSAGEISREAYEAIFSLMRVRNRVAHGFANDVTLAQFNALAVTTKAMLDDLGNAIASD